MKANAASPSSPARCLLATRRFARVAARDGRCLVMFIRNTGTLGRAGKDPASESGKPPVSRTDCARTGVTRVVIDIANHCIEHDRRRSCRLCTRANSSLAKPRPTKSHRLGVACRSGHNAATRPCDCLSDWVRQR